MEETHQINLESAPDSRDMDIIFYGLRAFNSSQTNGTAPQYIVITVRDSNKSVVGGLVGTTYVKWLYVQALWLPETMRGKGTGRTLLVAAEAEAARRGCKNVWLDTFSFQALPFYEKLGYSVFASLHEYPPGGVKYFLTKSLSQT